MDFLTPDSSVICEQRKRNKANGIHLAIYLMNQ